MDIDIIMMRRALQLAANGEGFTSSNPMVGAVITDADGKIIGEGWHRRFGGPHAEVNAVNSVKDKSKLSQATIYVTLEPCSHYGKTPPCAELIVKSGFHRVVVGAPDPNPLVAGRGIRMIRDAGIEVTENVLRDECIEFNHRFMTAHTLHRPWIQLKWAQTANGFIAGKDDNDTIHPIKISNPASTILMHRQRALTDAIMVGTNTVIIDNPSLTLRYFPGLTPRPVIFRSDRIPASAKVLQSDPIIFDKNLSLTENVRSLYSDFKLISLMVEGGAELLKSFIDAGLYDEIRIEMSPVECKKGIPAPQLPAGLPMPQITTVGDNKIFTYRKSIIDYFSGRIVND